ncbi:endo-1,3(4)-beta-glucanase [Lipomyces japonicus]|uniref:endo-1,3(4)-beta-glucanase n=1 Tax=Lipomyces japonicus TaxID=56871 RepID=UPI0034D00A63
MYCQAIRTRSSVMLVIIGFWLIISFAHALPVAVGTVENHDQTAVATSTGKSGPVQYLISTPASSSSSLGTIASELETAGRVTTDPMLTIAPAAAATTSVPATVFTTYTAGQQQQQQQQQQQDGLDSVQAVSTIDLFKPIATTAPSQHFPRLLNHPQSPTGFSAAIVKQSPIPTNNFYSNLFLGTRSQPAYVYPYSVWWNQGVGGDYGLAISHTSASQRVFGPNANANPVEYYINPTGIRSLSFSAAEFDSGMTTTLTDPQQFSVNIIMTAAAKHGNGKSLQVPLVEGSAFLTGIYYNLQPRFSSLVGFRSLAKKSSPRAGVVKYLATLNDGNVWAIYATVPSGQSFSLILKNSALIQASTQVRNVVVQIAQVPSGTEAIYDAHAGKFSVGATVSGTAVGNVGTAQILWSTKGANNANKLLLFALAHHSASFQPFMKSRATLLKLDSPTKGIMTAYSTNNFVFQENLPMDIKFAPWTSISGKSAKYSASFLNLLSKTAISEASQDMDLQTNSDSMYSAGKALDKFAYICYTSHAILQNKALTKYCLDKLKISFARFANNTQVYPLYYDQTYKGLISSGAILTGNSLADYGNSYYNDHHFHYGYHIHAAAVIGLIDTALGGKWVNQNKDYVNSLVRDIANPSSADSFYPVSRSFSWFHGHSWAKGLFESADGKDQESSSEDYNHAYAIKLWGQVIGDSSMEARGAMMLALMRRSMNSYILMASDNTIQPSNFINNKVAGIIFENKCDHTTYFGTNLEYIQGIHMIPITPASSFVRQPTFVQQEWNSKLKNLAPSLSSGWKGILYANLALFDPSAALKFFASSSFNSAAWLDGGASLTWYLAYAAGVGGTS